MLITSPGCFATLVATLSLLATNSAIPAQALSGSYTIDPNGSGTRNFKKPNDASIALGNRGVSGPVTMTLALGSHSPIWYIGPIPGTSSTNTVVFRAAIRHGSTIEGHSTGGTSIEFLFGTNTTPIQWITLDGLRFTGLVKGYLNMQAHPTGNQHITVKNCQFLAVLSGGVSLHGIGHDIHHNTFRRGGSTAADVLVLGEKHSIHHNSIQAGRIYVAGSVLYNSRCEIYNNLVYDTTSPAIEINNAHDSIVAHNTVVGKLRFSFKALVQIRGNPIRPVTFMGNTLICTETGTDGGPLLYDWSASPGVIVSNGNLFYTMSSSRRLVQVGPTSYTSLSSWQQASGQDKNSLNADPKFKNLGGDDYHLTSASPAINATFATFLFVTDDLDGNPRDLKPDLGCYEFFQAFNTFGAGCPGTLLHIPRIGVSGSTAMGSSSFAFTVANGLGGARAFLSLGASNKTWGTVPLPLNMGGTCNLLVSLDFILPVQLAGQGGGNGTGNVRIGLPTNPAFIGETFFAQWAIADPIAAQGLAFSSGGALTLR